MLICCWSRGLISGCAGRSAVDTGSGGEEERDEDVFVIADAAMNDLIRPALYQAHHEILPVAQARAGAEAPVDVVGPVCESGDFFARDRAMPKVEAAGDLVALLDAGALRHEPDVELTTRGRGAGGGAGGRGGVEVDPATGDVEGSVGDGDTLGASCEAPGRVKCWWGRRILAGEHGGGYALRMQKHETRAAGEAHDGESLARWQW